MYQEKEFKAEINTYNIKLPKRYQKVLNLCPAFDNTVVFLGIYGFRQDCLTHFTQDGNLLG